MDEIHALDLDGLAMPALGFGTWELQGRECRSAVAAALAEGYRHLDTAAMYDNEEEVGRALAEASASRHEVFVTTKVWWDHLEPDALRRSTHDSLRKLRTDHVDLLLVHWPNPDVPLGDTLSAMETLRREGKVRRIGVSNFPRDLLRQAADLAGVACDQVEYHPFLSQEELLEEVRKRGMVLTAYSPLAHGRAIRDDTLREIGDRHGVGPAQVALRWLLDQESVAAIPRSSDRDHIRANLRVTGFSLTGEERERIDGLARGERVVDPEFAPDW